MFPSDFYISCYQPHQNLESPKSLKKSTRAKYFAATLPIATIMISPHMFLLRLYAIDPPPRHEVNLSLRAILTLFIFGIGCNAMPTCVEKKSQVKLCLPTI